jgi:glycosyltransferase involved in cell wall biosynthesis
MFDFPWDSTPANLHIALFPATSNDHFASRPLLRHIRQILTAKSAILHLHGLWEPLSASAAKMARRQQVPYVCSIHGMLDPWSVSQGALKKRLYFSLIERRRLAHAAALHFTAQGEADKAAPWTPPAPRRIVIPVLMNLAPFEQLPERSAAHAHFPNIPAEAPWILFLSRIHEKKGLDLLIDAVARLPNKDAQLVIAGAGDSAYVQSLKNRARHADIAGRTHFVGLVQGLQKTALLHRADLLALPTSQENFGIVFAEALACQTPVLVTEGVDICQELLSSGGALLIRRDPEDIAGRIAALLTDPTAARAKGQAGRQWVFAHLAPQIIAQQWLEAYHAIAATRR